jgi:DNA-binding CsgD family transcriptional regulator
VLLGRDAERQLLDDLLTGARHGRSGVLAVVGEVGIGKSALLDHAADAAAGMQVLRARGVRSETHIPFGGLFELVRPVLGHLDDLAAPQRHALEAALALRPAQPQGRFAVGAATLGLLAAGAEASPVLVLVDDAHWLDGSSADSLLFAFRRLVADPIAVVLTVRQGEASLVDDTDLPVHHLGGLDREATGELLVAQARTGHGPLTAGVVDRLHRGTGGNPLALIEALADERALDAVAGFGEPLPVGARIRRAYAQRYAALPAPVADALVLAATSDTGDLPTLTRAAAHAGVDPAHLGGTDASRFLLVGVDRVQFHHPLARAAVYDAAPAERRRVMHGALAKVLPDSEADRRAWHLALAALGPDDAASAALEQAARRARHRSAYEVASRAAERAAALAEGGAHRAALLAEAADDAWLGGHPARALQLVDRAGAQSPTPELLVTIDHLRGHIATRMGPVDDGRRILLAGAERAATFDPDHAVVMLAEVVSAAFYASDVAAMAAAAERIRALLSPQRAPRSAFFAELALGMACIFSGISGVDDRKGAEHLRRAVAIISDSEELSEDPRLLTWAATGPLWLRELIPGPALVDRAIAVAREQAAVGVLPFLLGHIAVDHAGRDRWSDAEAGFEEAINLARETGQRTDLAFALARLAWVNARQGRADDCRDRAGEARVHAQQLGFRLAEIWAHAALGDLALGLGGTEEAIASYGEQRALLARLAVRDPDLSPEPELVELALRQGRRAEAEDLQASFERRAATKGQPWARARAARGRGLLCEAGAIDQHFGEALRWHDRTPDVFERARTQLAWGARLRRARQRVRAREQLQAAVDTFDPLGARPWADTARAELAATGVTARARDASTRDRLTPQERQVALALAAGQTTREAAAALFISPKTVEFHLRSIYRKLGVSSRTELTAAMSEQ